MVCLTRFCLPAFLVVCAAAPAWAQSDYMELYAHYARQHLYVESFVLPAESGPIAFFSLRVPNSLLVFKREREPSRDAEFVARVEVTIHVRDGDRLVTERIWRTTHRAGSYEESVSPSSDLEATIRIALEPGTYAYRVWVRNSDVDAPLPAPAKRLVVPDFQDLTIGPPVVTSSPPAVPGELMTVNLGGNVPYGVRSWVILPVSLPPQAHGGGASLTYRLLELPFREGSRTEIRRRRPEPPESVAEERWDLVEDVREPESGGKEVSRGTFKREEWQGIVPVPTADSSTSSHTVFLEHDGAGRHFFVAIPVPATARGHLAIETSVESSAGEVSRTDILETYWRNMPLSLYSLQLSIRNLSFIESREQVREMLRGSDQDRKEAFEAYWDERDPTPETPENELMQEYYHRIDYAAHEFRTGKRPGPDGLATDQARIYVVHGPPLNVERAFPDSGGVEETWVYEDGRRFVFWAASSLDPLALKTR